MRAEETRAHTEEELVLVARSKPIDRAPGGRFAYSNTNYLLLGVVASAAAGVHWSEYMREQILDPLGPHAYDGGVYDGAFVGLANFIEVDDGEFGEVYGHSGGTPGFSTNMRRLEQDGRTQVVLLNGNTMTSDDFNNLTSLIWQALLL